jgi:HK97 family phage major capsid protein
MKTTSLYNKTFWNVIRGNQPISAEMNEGADNAGGYITPMEFNDKYSKALEKENVFRRLGTVVHTTSSEGTIHAVSSTGTAEWVNEMIAIPESTDTFAQFPIKSNKLASLTRIKEQFVKDNNFDLERYLQNEFSRRFGRSEEQAFINGNGTDAPCGILNATGGGEIGVTTTGAITYDEVIKLYFSLDSEHRRNAVWLMNDETALTLRTLKDVNGNYLLNTSDNTILGKPVQYSSYMPNAESDKLPIAFGDFSYYWIIQRQSLSIRILKEKYSLNGQLGLLAYERLDGKLILSEAVKLLKMAQ